MEPTSALPPTADAVVAEIERRVSYFRIALDAPPDEGWVSAADLIADAERLQESIRTAGQGRGAPDDQVAASLWFQGYAFRVALPVVAPFALGLAGLSVEPGQTSIRIARSRPAAVAVTGGDMAERTAESAAFDLCSSHLAPMVDAITSAFTIGRRLLWGNAAASVATVFRTLDGAPGADRVAVQAKADEFFAQAQPWFAGLGGFETVSEAGQVGWYWTRTNCCLYEQCDGAVRCDDCSLTSAADLERDRRAALTLAAVEVAS